MADYDVTAPNGKKFRISAPEGATQEQVLNYAKEQFAKMPPEPAQSPEKPSFARTVLDAVNKTSPAGIVSAAMKKQAEATDALAYKTGGAVTDLTGSPGAGYAANLGVQAIPVVAGGAITKLMGAPMLESAATSLMQKAVKPNAESLMTRSATDPTKSRAAAAIQTMLDEGVNATEGGMLKLRFQLDKLKKEVEDLIAKSPSSIDRQKVAEQLFPVLERAYRQATPKGDIAKVEAAFEEFMNHPLLQGADKIPVQLAQAMKKAGNKKLENAYGELGAADAEAQKALVRGLKEGVAQAVPGVAERNARMGEILNVLKTAEQRAMMAGNNNPLGFAPLAHEPMSAMAVLADRNPWIKSLLAHGLYQSQGAVPTAAGGSLAAILSQMHMGQPPSTPGNLERLQRGP